jgi:hypothetical protein
VCCARVCAACAQTCVQHHISSIGECVERAQNVHTHSLGLCDEDKGVVELECTRVGAARAQTCAQHHISSIGGQTAGPIGLKIGTDTHWDYAMKIGG